MLGAGAGRIQVRVPYWTTNERVVLIVAGGIDNGFNGVGFRFGRGPFSLQTLELAPVLAARRLRQAR